MATLNSRATKMEKFTFFNVGSVNRKVKLNMKTMILIGIIVLLSNCSNAEYDLNPWTTVVRELITQDKIKGEK